MAHGVVYGWYSDNSVCLKDPGVYLRPGVYSVVVLEESPCPRGSPRNNFQFLVLVFESQVLDNKASLFILSKTIIMLPCWITKWSSPTINSVHFLECVIILFADNVYAKLRYSGAWWHLYWFSVLWLYFYADDIVLSSCRPSCYGLQKLIDLNVCSVYGDKWNIKFNPDKPVGDWFARC